MDVLYSYAMAHSSIPIEERRRFDEAVPFKVKGAYCKLIPLTRGQYAIVWELDYRWLIEYNWYALWSRSTRSYYAVRNCPMVSGKRGPMVQMHRELLGLKPYDGIQGDHENHVTLDCRRDNVRKASAGQNQYNSGKKATNTSGYKGVYFHPPTGRWTARLTVNGKIIYLQYHDTPELASAEQRAAAIKYHGKFAKV